MSEHTPTPWVFSPWHIEEGPSAVRAPAGHIVATTASDADAELIVKAVNSHEALVKALESLAVDPPATLDEPDPDCEVIAKMRAIARDALARVGGPNP